MGAIALTLMAQGFFSLAVQQTHDFIASWNMMLGIITNATVKR